MSVRQHIDDYLYGEDERNWVLMPSRIQHWPEPEPSVTPIQWVQVILGGLAMAVGFFLIAALVLMS